LYVLGLLKSSLTKWGLIEVVDISEFIPAESVMQE
jgi:hypothetical protein